MNFHSKLNPAKANDKIEQNNLTIFVSFFGPYLVHNLRTRIFQGIGFDSRIQIIVWIFILNWIQQTLMTKFQKHQKTFIWGHLPIFGLLNSIFTSFLQIKPSIHVQIFRKTTDWILRYNHFKWTHNNEFLGPFWHSRGPIIWLKCSFCGCLPTLKKWNSKLK